jgi:hypothetical protein
MAIPSSLSRSFSTFPLCSGTTLIEIAVYKVPLLANAPPPSKCFRGLWSSLYLERYKKHSFLQYVISWKDHWMDFCWQQCSSQFWLLVVKNFGIYRCTTLKTRMRCIENNMTACQLFWKALSLTFFHIGENIGENVLTNSGQTQPLIVIFLFPKLFPKI